MIDLKQKEVAILTELKDFQRATVERVHHLFTNNFSRVLVADEVGLGKTLVARGVIATTARYQKEQEDKLFKVVYVCSNQNIATQNLSKLKIDEYSVDVGSLSDTRLSMQHLKIFEDEYNPKVQENSIQLIPLTPSTSFKMTLGCGSVRERALIFTIMKQIEWLGPFLNTFEMMMIDAAYKSWEFWKREYENRVNNCNVQSKGTYIRTMQHKIERYFQEHPQLTQKIIDVCTIYKQYGDRGKREDGQVIVIQQLRKMMAEASIDLIHADLVIMDEFQRFPELIHADHESETAMLANKFFNHPTSKHSQVKILLLSATPYKPYSTLEEIAESGNDEHYKEFMQVTDFLFEKHPQHKKNFQRVWSDYSSTLSEVSTQDFAMIVAQKQAAENSLYKGIARTERFLEDKATGGSSATIDTEPLNITKDDVMSYIEMSNLIQDVGLTNQVPVEYVKSAPFLMSFMDHYKLKEKITQATTKQSINHGQLKNPLLWLDKRVISKYGKLQETNARLTRLKKTAMPKGAENLLWVPPSLPYYEFGGYYEGMASFSKVLVFSGWEMVPRSIATLISYEAERKTVGKLVNNIPRKKRTKAHKYFAEQRFPRPRLTYSTRNNTLANMNHLTLLYPSPTLAKLFDPFDTLNRNLTLTDLRAEIKNKLSALLDELAAQVKTDDGRRDERWYYIAPLLLDKNETVIQNWFEQEFLLYKNGTEPKGTDNDFSAVEKHFEALRDIFHADSPPTLGRKPDDLLEILTTMVLGSPAICALRLLNNVDSNIIPDVIQLGKTIVDRFNSQEMTSVVSMRFKKDAQWKGVLKYCVDGNFQAMLDEFAHMLLGDGGLNKEESNIRNKQLMFVMMDALTPGSSTLNVDTHQSFKRRVSHGNSNTKGGSMNLRTNFAVGFYDKRNTDESTNRTNNVRLAFNSPFRPFVLATTSVGQEGLDFHYYCRKIMHWNLPSNPIDIEQRDGRINRYKNLSIRQKIANKYGNITFNNDIWNEMFTTASEMERDEDTSELVPFWLLPGDDGKDIERIFSLYPFSRDGAKYDRLYKVLELYRLSLGQPRQGDLLERLLNSGVNDEQLNALFMNLSPFAKMIANPVYH